MSFEFLAQASSTAAGEGTNWEKWLAIFAGVTIVQAFIQPLGTWFFKDFLGRMLGMQAAGDLSLQLISSSVKRIELDVQEVKTEIKKVQSDGSNMKLETQGDLGELARTIEREFIRKEEHKDDMDRISNMIADQFGQVSRRLDDVLKGRR